VQARGNDEAPDPPGAGKVATGEILTAAREMKDAAEAAGRITAASPKNSACIHADNQGKELDLLTYQN
jgi:hypothetical protein